MGHVAPNICRAALTHLDELTPFKGVTVSGGRATGGETIGDDKSDGDMVVKSIDRRETAAMAALVKPYCAVFRYKQYPNA